MSDDPPDQLDLFAGGRAAEAPRAAPVGAAPVSPRLRALAAALPPEVRFGSSSWSFPGWAGLVYDRVYPVRRLAHEGLAAYAQHPLLRVVGIDRTLYEPLPAEELAAYAAAVPPEFRFVVKAHDAVTLARFPDLPRFGARRGTENPRFLDAAYAAAEVVEPFRRGFGARGAAILFQFAPQELGPPARFARRLGAFLAALPRGPLYGVELRNRELVTVEYGAALAAAGACHCANVFPRMPDVRAQLALSGAARAPAVFVRWMLRDGMSYEDTGRRWRPFNRIHEPDRGARQAIAEVAREAAGRGQPVFVTVANNAEGSASLSILALAEELVGAKAFAPGSSQPTAK